MNKLRLETRRNVLLEKLKAKAEKYNSLETLLAETVKQTKEILANLENESLLMQGRVEEIDHMLLEDGRACDLKGAIDNLSVARIHPQGEK